jgi:HSP20 family protein
MYLTTRTFGQATVLPLDVVRRDGDVVLRFDVPGIDPEPDKFVVRARTMGTFTRRVSLSKSLNADAIEAAYSNGVLEVRIPVLEQDKPRKVEVRQGDEQKKLAA